MNRQQYREEWINRNACKFCQGNDMHTCDLYKCDPAIERAEKYFDKVIEQKESRGMKLQYITDIKPWM